MVQRERAPELPFIFSFSPRHSRHLKFLTSVVEDEGKWMRESWVVEPSPCGLCIVLAWPSLSFSCLSWFSSCTGSDTDGMKKQLGQEVMSKDTDLAFID